MSNNKKFLLIEMFFLAVPLIIAFLNATYSNLNNFPLGYDNINLFSGLAIILALLGNIYIYWRNRNSVPSSKIWSFISLALVILLLVFWYFGYSLSNFGF